MADLEAGAPCQRKQDVDHEGSSQLSLASTFSLCTEVSHVSAPLAGSRSSRHADGTLDYFLSHKKSHSKHGSVPEQIAKNVHDSLEILGHRGFLDMDDLDEISEDNLTACIRRCSTMVVYMNDETMQSEWCVFEWKTAHRFNLPIRVVVDVSHCFKKDVVDAVQEQQLGFLLQYQWLEYNDATRRATIQRLSDWIGQEIADRMEAMVTRQGALCVKDGDEFIQLFHPFFEYYMVFCGLVYNEKAWSWRVISWTRLVRTLALGCFGICMFRLIYATGPAYTDWYLCLYVVNIHVFLFHGIWVMVRFLRSDDLRGILEHISISCLATWTGRRINFISKWAAVMGMIAGSATAAGMIWIYLPLFLSDVYMHSALGMTFGISSAMFFVFVAPVVLLQEFAVLTLLFVTTQLLRDIYESSVCNLSDLLAFVGLHGFVKAGKNPFIQPTENRMRRFSHDWCKARAFQMKLQQQTNSVVYVNWLFNLTGIAIPLVYLLYGDDFLKVGQPWHKFAKPVLWWAFALACYVATVAVPALASYQLDDLQDIAKCLSLPPREREFLLVGMQMDIRWKFGPLRVTGLGIVAVLLPMYACIACAFAVASKLAV